MSPSVQLRCALSCYHTFRGTGTGGGHRSRDTAWAEAAEECIQANLCFPLLFSWPCCPGISGVAESIVQCLPKHPELFTVGLSRGATTTFQEYNRIVRVPADGVSPQQYTTPTIPRSVKKPKRQPCNKYSCYIWPPLHCHSSTMCMRFCVVSRGCAERCGLLTLGLTFPCVRPSARRCVSHACQVSNEAGIPPTHSGKYRATDGGGNNAQYPWLGQGRRPYAVRQYLGRKISPDSLPDAVKVVRKLWPRRKFEPAPNRTNALMVWLATFISHDLHYTHDGLDGADGQPRPWENLHSSYLDLQPLYGHRPDATTSVRQFEGGKLQQDQFAERRFGKFPVCAALAILLSREHNYVAEQLAARYPDKFTTDEALFQQARLIMGAVYINIIARDFASGLTGLNPQKGRPVALLAAAMGPKHRDPAGCHVSWELNYVFRLHETIPMSYNIEHARAGRGKSIEDLISEALTTPSGRFGPGHCPIDQIPEACLDLVEAKALALGREIGLPNFNLFRESLGLPRYASLEALTGDAKGAKALKTIYSSVDDVEFYVGLKFEQPSRDGWGMAETTYTMVLMDLISRISNDRFYTTDYTREVYTAWGYDHSRKTSLAHILSRHSKLQLSENECIMRMPPEISATTCQHPGKNKVTPTEPMTMNR